MPLQLTERIIDMSASDRKSKKYTAIVQNDSTDKIRTIHFGHKGYEQYRDITQIGKYSYKDHYDTDRRRKYFSRFSGVPTKRAALQKEIRKSKGKYNAKILSHKYLW
jgi:hypothetical protein